MYKELNKLFDKIPQIFPYLLTPIELKGVGRYLLIGYAIKETAAIIVEVLEETINKAIEEAQERQKAIITEELKKELATKYDIEFENSNLDTACCHSPLKPKFNRVYSKTDWSPEVSLFLPQEKV